MNANRPNQSPVEDGELEDGEICDDEIEENVPMRRGEGSRLRGGAGQRTRKPHPQNIGPLLGHQPPGFLRVLPYNHGPFPPNHRQQCGPSGPDRPPFPPAAHGLPLPPPPGLGLLGEPSPRSNFWERSHDALGRFRHRVVPNRGRGGRGNFRAPPSRYGPPDIHGSPLRKQKPPVRNRARKDGSGIPGSRVDAGTNESFEDLLSKYKQIQLELECIRKEETMVLGPAASPLREGAAESVAGPPEAAPAPGLGPGPTGAEELVDHERKEKKVFHAFNIKPLRQKLPVPATLDQSQTECVDPGAAGGAAAGSLEQTAEGGAAVVGELCVICSKVSLLPPGGASGERGASEAGVKGWCGCCSEDAQPVSSCPSQSPASSEESAILPDKVEKVEEEELSELQLRLLALQSASKKWQQKEQQVMKKSKDRISKAAQDKNSGSGLTSPTKQRVTTRSASAAAAAAAATDRNSRSRSKLADKERTKTRPRPADRERPKQSPKLGSKAAPARSRTPARPHSSKKITGPGSAVKQTFRKQQLHTWKQQQQQKKLEEKRRQEEEDRRKREEEIRRIRDLSNQDEQYNRFMRLVGGRRTRSGSRDQDQRKSAGKLGLDTLGNLYQYDNYDEVAMDTDSETGSPASSPQHDLLSAHEAGRFPPSGLYRAESIDFEMPFLSSTLQSVPPPPPPLPPPDELEPPPKPPFADEEEEEEMLLRETCLMSMANKRVAAEKSSSAPTSPSCPLLADVQPPARGNLSVVSLNTVPAGRGGRFTRTHHASRAPLVLPRHKSVVVSLNDSDDSDSDVDACSSSQVEFGGLEFMIKEARRTVEAAKPKAASGCEKENNPVRSAEAPEAQKANFLLQSEQLSRDRPRKDPSGSPAPEPGLDPFLWPAAELRLSKVEHRLSKHRELLQRDEVILRHLLQQELKKTESLKTAEAKVAKLREQLHASERVVVANRTLLKKLQEQVQRVEQRVSVKKTQAVHLEKELIQAQLAAGQGAKRPADSTPSVPSKMQRLDASRHFSEQQFAELIAQKRRLQQLEAEYALKIQKLKEAQALRNKTGPAEPQAPASIPPPDPPVEPLPAPATFLPPQPSLHDLSQDKLALDSEDVPDADDQEPEPPAAPISKDGRRSSLRQSNSSFTKPHLDAVNSSNSKDGSCTKLAKTGGGGELPAEMFSGLNMESLKQRFQQQTQLGELLHREVHKLGGDVSDPPAQQFPVQVLPLEGETSQSAGSELKPVPFKAYHSPLLTFRSYRFSPYYRTKEKLSLSSVTFSNAIQANKCFCRFDLMGTCNHDGCRWQHMRNCTLSRDQLYQDILSYNLSLIGCSETSSDQEISDATESYLKKLFGPNKDRMSVDQMALLLLSKVNESKKHVPPFTTCKDARKWKPKPSVHVGADGEEDSEDEAPEALPTSAGDGVCRSGAPPVDTCVTSEDRRYFISETDDIANLEASVLESPRDTQLWIKLAFKYLNQTDTSTAESLEAALNTLSRALESNCEDPEVWSHYLLLFSRRGSQEEVQEMCEMAVEHAPDYRVWWNYLNLESSFEGRDYVCERLLQYLVVEASCDGTERRSFQLMEALLYRVQLSLFTGRMESALAILQNALKSSQERSVADHMTPADRALLWLSYIHLTEFDQLPASLFDPTESGPGRIVSKEPFLLPWRTSQDVSTPPDILIALFEDAVQRCSEESASDGERTLACLPLHSNLILLYKLLQKYEQGVSLCETLLEACPDSCTLRSALADLHLSQGDAESAASTWLRALAECPHDAQVFYNCCCFLMNQQKSSGVPPLLRAFMLSLCEDNSSRMSPVDILRHLLGFPTKELPTSAVIKKELQGPLRQQIPMLHLLHCRWQWLQGGLEEVVEAFERALGSPLQLNELHQLWMDYLLFSCSPQAGADAAQLFPDLVHRCLSTIPSRLELPFNPAMFWSSYRFHNKVVTLYLRHIPQPQRALVLERLRDAMPNNIELGLRFLLQEWQNGNLEQVKFQARMLSNCAPRCLSSWRIAIAVEKELRERAEVRLLFDQALQHLPLCAALWKHRLLYEAAEGGASQRLQRLVDRCRLTGVSVSLGGVGPLLADDV